MSYHDKKILCGKEGINNLAPFKYPWAWDMVKKSLKNHWIPEEVPMGQDKLCFEQRLSPAESEMFTNVFATLTTSDVVIGRNVAVDIYGIITAPEIQAYLSRQIAEEMLHSLSYQHCIEVLGLDQDGVYNRYREIPEIAAKFGEADRWAKRLYAWAGNNRNDVEEIMLALIFYYAIFEGIWFYNGFSPIFSLQRRNLMTGTGEQLQYIMRDESMHIAFGIRLLREIEKEFSGRRPTQAEVHNLFGKAIRLEAEYAHRVIPNVLGYSADMHIEQTKYLANRRLNQLGYDAMFGAANVLPWLDEQINLNKEKNFFESRVTEYQSSAGLAGTWD